MNTVKWKVGILGSVLFMALMLTLPRWSQAADGEARTGCLHLVLL